MKSSKSSTKWCGEYVRNKLPKSLVPKEPLNIKEIGNGNMNYVFNVSNAIAVKTAPPFVKVVPTFSLSERRVIFEGRYLQTLFSIDKEAVIHPLHLDEKDGVLVTEFLPHAITLRTAMLEGKLDLNGAFKRIGAICAKSYFCTSEFGASREKRETLIRRFQGNEAMRDLTADVIFTSPWLPFQSPTFPNNHHPLLSDIVKSLQNGQDNIRCIVSVLKHRFLTSKECLLHGDLHTGSIFLAGDARVRIFDSEFCMMGPVSFDLGLLMAHILISAMSARGRDEKKPQLELAEALWNSFRSVLTELWESKHTDLEDSNDSTLPVTEKGNVYSPGMFLQKDSRKRARDDFFDRVFRETCGFASIAMIRRCIGVVSVEDLASIKNERRRAECECDIIRLARVMLLNADANMELKQAIEEKRIPRAWNMSRLLNSAKTILRFPCTVKDDSIKIIQVPWLDDKESKIDAKTLKNFFEIRGDLLKTDDCKFIVHQTNCMTSHALGLAKHIFKLWPHANVYSERKDAPGGWKKHTSYSVPGTVDVRRGKRGVINLFGQNVPGKIERDDSNRKLSIPATKSLRLKWFDSAVKEIAKIKDLDSVAFPYEIGCGLAGGDWSEYRKRILNLARSRPDVRVVIVRLSNDDEKKFKKDVEKDKKHNKEARKQFHASIGGRGRGRGRGRSRRQRGWR